MDTSTHPITGRATCKVAGETRVLAFDMNCAAVLFEAKGPDWNNWLVQRFLGEEVSNEARRVTPLTPGDSITALYALLATDREDTLWQESEVSLRRSVSPVEMPHLQLAMIKVVLTGFGLPGETVEAVLSALDKPPQSPARPVHGTGPGPLRSRSAR